MVRAVDGDAAGRCRCGSAACSCGSSALHAVDGLDDVGARLAVDDHEHRRLAVGQAQRCACPRPQSMTSATSDSRTAAPLR